YQQQATIRRYSRSLEIDFQRGVEGELKGLVLLFTHWVQASGVSLRRQNRINTGVGSIIRRFRPTSKRKCGLISLYQDSSTGSRWGARPTPSSTILSGVSSSDF